MSLKLICQSVPRAGTEAVFPAGQVLQEMLLAKPVQYKICKKKCRRPRDIFLQISDLARFVRRVSCKIRKISDMQEIAGESCDSGRVTTILCGRQGVRPILWPPRPYEFAQITPDSVHYIQPPRRRQRRATAAPRGRTTALGTARHNTHQ